MVLPPALRKVLNKEKKHKYGAKRTTCLHGHDHDSRKESLWCLKLHQELKEKKITHLLLQPVFELKVHNSIICKHYPDFMYMRGPNPEILEVKGMKTRDWIIKHKLFLALYPTINYVVV